MKCWLFVFAALFAPDVRNEASWEFVAARLADAVANGAGNAAFTLVRNNVHDSVEEALVTLADASNGDDKGNAEEALDAYRKVITLMKTYPTRLSGGYEIVQEGEKCAESLDKISGQRAKRIWFLVACLRVAIANEFSRIEYDNERAEGRATSAVLYAQARFAKWKRTWVRRHLIYYVKDDSHWRGDRLEWRGRKEDRPKQIKEIIEYIDLVELKLNKLDKAFPKK